MNIVSASKQNQLSPITPIGQLDFDLDLLELEKEHFMLQIEKLQRETSSLQILRNSQYHKQKITVKGSHQLIKKSSLKSPDICRSRSNSKGTSSSTKRVHFGFNK
ncbi:hypothetical protein pb186bvf_012584 [Paramecium bursaria]